ncbi:PEPxxWA-CTERM sorting domain-containing protein [Novosphingobium piscinae]|uniref:PEP-CTERM sorting domain-containing protein n=1 Tax=Novosphingobium piscinae TaxID=1507448 RepID=A0A7X1KPW4_9SPHN|nr:PEPxxWA-CTERM sorting domain-containing protein [Novosphingobium piscinae]MBC2669147.1 PEP-CTERM sorting domain-containing protein [Novosphingobium piscinae]
MATAAAWLATAPAQAAVLDFSGDICGVSATFESCGNGSVLNQGYGDIAGQLDVIYSGLFRWGSGYNGTTDVAYAGQNVAGEIFLSPLSGFSVTLNSLSLHSWLSANRNTSLVIRDGSNTLLAGPGALSFGTTYNSGSLNLTSTNGLKIQWGPDAFNVGIDNVAFTVQATQTNGAVPEPSTWAMMLVGFGAVGAALRRRQQVQLRYA